jgi:2-polyprenyl-3-methyl-5-hydroxy-6-metoxy-1,4-benzoquinol methylase
MNTKEHYDKHLANVYSWMLGDFDLLVSNYYDYFKANNILSINNQIAFDFGCGNGVQSIALAKLGYSVFSFDFNKQLLNELESNRNNHNITIIESDFTHFDKYSDIKPDVIICMGDTITHLSDKSEIEILFNNCNKVINGNGLLTISFRDYSTPLTGLNRFIPVKSDENRILTCFLEYFDNYVIVNDLLHEKENGKWIQKVSSYKKIRISENEIIQSLIKSNFQIVSSEIINRMVYLIAKKYS